MEGILGYLFIFCARVVDMSGTTVRTILLVRGQRLIAAVIGFFEVTVYILALNRVVGKLNDPLNLLFYSLGFATGNYVGSIIEERVALGFVTVEIIPTVPGSDLAERLRRDGYGVTCFPAEGKEGPRLVLHVLVKRKRLPHLLETLTHQDEKAFYSIMDARSIHGGFFGRQGK
ncbi:MAG TPA: DUF2179 domain-containing protein [Firmicutes bacterium]|nr:DUF2179 domain-containing protein [Bacillota bacterium]